MGFSVVFFKGGLPALPKTILAWSRTDALSPSSALLGVSFSAPPAQFFSLLLRLSFVLHTPPFLCMDVSVGKHNMASDRKRSVIEPLPYNDIRGFFRIPALLLFFFVGIHHRLKVCASVSKRKKAVGTSLLLHRVHPL